MNFLKKHIRLAILFSLIINIAVIVFYFNKKEVFHPDETWSYAHSNSTQGAFLVPNLDSFFLDMNNELHYRWFEGKELKDYISVQENERFKYAHIWDNLKKDVHPPLYYMFLHTISSFFIDGFSKWYAFGINIVMFVVAYLMFYKLSKLFIKDELLALLPVVFWGFSHVNIAMNVYLRMYVLLSVWLISLFYEIIKFFDDEKISNKRLFLIFIFSFLGMFTHYSALVFNFSLFGVGCFILLCQKKYKNMFILGGVGILSVLFLTVISPSFFDVLTKSQRGVECLDVFKEVLDRELIYNKMQFLWNFIKIDIFSFDVEKGDYFVRAIFGLFFVLMFFNSKKIKLNKRVVLLCSVIGLFSLYLVFFMPKMGNFNLRYCSIIAPYCCLLIFMVLIKLGQMLKLNNTVIFGILAIIVVFNSINCRFDRESDFRFQSKKEDLVYFDKIKNKKVLVVTLNNAGGYFDLIEFSSNVKQIFAIKYMCNPILSDYLTAHEVDYVLLFNGLFFKNLNNKPEKVISDCMFLLDDYKYLQTVNVGQAYFDFYERK